LSPICPGCPQGSLAVFPPARAVPRFPRRPTCRLKGVSSGPRDAESLRQTKHIDFQQFLKSRDARLTKARVHQNLCTCIENLSYGFQQCAGNGFGRSAQLESEAARVDSERDPEMYKTSMVGHIA